MASKIIKLKCPACGEIAEEESRSSFGELVFVKLKCGHSVIDDKIKELDIYDFTSMDGRKPRPFQVDESSLPSKQMASA